MWEREERKELIRPHLNFNGVCERVHMLVCVSVCDPT